MIFATVVIVCASVLVWYGRSVAVSRYVLVASQLGEELMEQCVGAGFHKAEFLATPTDEPRKISLRTVMRDYEVVVNYECRVEVKEVNDDLKRVFVGISWEDERGPEEVKFETLLFRQE